jgi:tetratricopeptide (TPR) repeat protein
MACIDPRDIPQSILPPAVSAKKQTEAIGLLKAYSFLTTQARDGLFSLHRLVHLATRNWLRTDDSLSIWTERAACQLTDVFPQSPYDDRKIWGEYLPHAFYLTYSEELQSCQHDYSEFLSRIGRCLQSDGRYSEAQILLDDTLEIEEKALGPEHPTMLASVSRLVAVLAQQGKYKEAEVMLQ